MITTVFTKRFVLCPACRKSEHCIEQLLQAGSYTFGPWSCDLNECGAKFIGAIRSDGTVELQVTGRREPRGLALLQLGDLYLVLKEQFGRVENWDYFYHSHQCPTNLLRDVFQVYGEDGRRDPHGRLRYVAGIADTEEVREALDNSIGDLDGLFRIFGTSGEPPESQWPEADGGVIPQLAEWRRAARESEKGEN